MDKNFVPPQPIPPKPPEIPGQKKNKKALIILITGAFIFAAIIGFSLFLVIKGRGLANESRGNSNSSFASMIPIWVAVFIPIMAAKKKKGQEQKKISLKQKRYLRILVILSVLLVLATIFAWGYNI
jgi:hypothetical protein